MHGGWGVSVSRVGEGGKGLQKYIIKGWMGGGEGGWSKNKDQVVTVKCVHCCGL